MKESWAPVAKLHFGDGDPDLSCAINFSVIKKQTNKNQTNKKKTQYLSVP